MEDLTFDSEREAFNEEAELEAEAVSTQQEIPSDLLGQAIQKEESRFDFGGLYGPDVDAMLAEDRNVKEFGNSISKDVIKMGEDKAIEYLEQR